MTICTETSWHLSGDGAGGPDRRAVGGTRGLHDIVSHGPSIVLTAADMAAVVSREDPARGTETMTEASEVGRLALPDMPAMLRVLRYPK